MHDCSGSPDISWNADITIKMVYVELFGTHVVLRCTPLTSLNPRGKFSGTLFRNWQCKAKVGKSTPWSVLHLVHRASHSRLLSTTYFIMLNLLCSPASRSPTRIVLNQFRLQARKFGRVSREQLNSLLAFLRSKCALQRISNITFKGKERV